MTWTLSWVFICSRDSWMWAPVMGKSLYYKPEKARGYLWVSYPQESQG